MSQKTLKPLQSLNCSHFMVLLDGPRVAPERLASVPTWPTTFTENLTEDSRMFYVYMLCYPDGVPFYVGKGKGRRVRRHLTRSHNILVNRIIAKLRRNNQEPVIKIALEAECEFDAFRHEQELIAKYGRLKKGGTLVNLTDGGEGPTGVEVSEEQRQKHSVLMRQVFSDPEIRSRIIAANRKILSSPKTRAKLSEASKKMWLNPDLRQRMIQNISTGLKKSEAFKRYTESRRGIKRPKEVGQKISRSRMGIVASAEVRQRIRETLLSKGVQPAQLRQSESLRKLSDVDLIDARQMRQSGMTYQAIARHFGVSLSTIHRAINGARVAYGKPITK